jgi:predicted RNA binding protein with dsRBD fold (UPF0201 family)
MTKITVMAEIRPSEDEDKIKVAIATFFDYEKISMEERGLNKLLIEEAYSLGSLKKFHKILREERILDVARKYLIKGIEDDTITFMLHKQAASVGIISFVDEEKESPLGPIIVTIEYKEPMKVIDWLAPKTSKGQPLWENPMPNEKDNMKDL